MIRSALFVVSVTSAIAASNAAVADAYDDLVQVHTALVAAKSWHAEEHLANGITVLLDYSAPNRWRLQKPTSSDIIIGDDVYVVTDGHSMRLPFGGGMIMKMAQNMAFSVSKDLRDSIRDLGMQSLDGRSVHAYSWVAGGVPTTLYVGQNGLPVQRVSTDKKGTITVTYGKYNEPISIEAP